MAKTDEDILKEDPELAAMFTDDEFDDDDDADDFMDSFKGFNFARTNSQRQKKNGYVHVMFLILI
jgi:hypothetical protein